ncbi:MAG: MaoC family dehydratase [Pseudorhodoplanes sp.]
MTKLHWEDFTPGRVNEYGPHIIKREEIIAFASEFDPQPMHLDEEAGRQSLLGGLGASGWNTCGIVMRLLSDGFLLNSSTMGSPGIDEVRWLRPVRPNDRLTLRVEVLETRASRSRPDMGLVKFAYALRNQHDDVVLTMANSIMFGRRNPGTGGKAPLS